MGEYRNDTHRILDWILSRDDHQIFDRFSIWNSFCGVVCYEVIDAVIAMKLQRGELIRSKPAGTYYKKRVKVMEMHRDIKSKFNDIETMLLKISNRVDAIEDDRHANEMRAKKQRLWIQHNSQTVPPGGMLFLVDVMLASGEVVFNMRANQVAWKYYPDDPTNVIAWRRAE